MRLIQVIKQNEQRERHHKLESINDESRDKMEIEAIEDTISRASFMKRQLSNSKRNVLVGNQSPMNQSKQPKKDNFFLNVIPTSQSPQKPGK